MAFVCYGFRYLVAWLSELEIPRLRVHRKTIETRFARERSRLLISFAAAGLDSTLAWIKRLIINIYD